MEPLYKAPNLEISFDQSTRILYCNWIGFQEAEIIYQGGDIILDLVRELSITKVLNDNSRVTGPWLSATEWTARKWFPAMIEAGLKYFAWIKSPDIFADESAHRAMHGMHVVKTFDSYREAYDWLREQKG